MGARPGEKSLAPFARSLFQLGAAAGAQQVGAALQQLTVQGVALAMARGTSPSLPIIVFASLLFLAPHIESSATPLSLLTSWLLGLAASLWCFRAATPSWGAPIGFHGGWSFADVLLFGSPAMGAEALGVWRWRGDPVEGTPECAAVLVVIVAALGIARARRARGHGA